MNRFAFLGAVSALAACSQASTQPNETAASPSLAGQWDIVSIDGKAPAGRPGAESRPSLTFDENGYGGNIGCNGFGGIGLEHEGRWYGGYAMSTAMTCAEPLMGQEIAVQALLGSGPTIAWRGVDQVELATAKTRLVLRRSGPVPPVRDLTEPTPLIGTRWTFGALDGEAIQMPGARSGPTLVVEGDGYTLETPCLTETGGWTQTGAGRATLSPRSQQAKPCPSASQQQSRRWSAAMRGALRYLNGPNGEIVLAGSGHWMVGDGARRGATEQGLAAGRWQVEGGPTDAQRNGAKPAELIVAGKAYYLWDGCNRTEGLAILYDRQLFTHGSGLTTLAGCMPGRDDPNFKQVGLSNPRIGTTANGGLRLVSPAGEVRLRRVGPAPTGSGGVTSRLLPGMRFTIGEHGGGTLAILPGNRFRLTQPCGTTEGLWRTARGETEGSLRFGPEGMSETCNADPEARKLGHMFVGNLEVAIGPNRDIALFASRFGSVRARLDR